MVDLATQMDAGAAPAAKSTTTASFANDVVNASSRVPVVVHFLSSRSDACRGVQAALERATKGQADKVKLVTMDIDAHPQIASRLGVRAVPAVYAFQRGQPVDGFMGALPETQIKGFLERLIGPLDDSHDEALVEADTALAGGDAAMAAEIYSAVLEQDPGHLGAVGGLARALVAAGDLEAARALLAQVPEAGAKDKAIVAAQAALDLADQASSVGDLTTLEQSVAANPDDHQARYDLAIGLAGQGKREAAADTLLESIRRDRTWNEGAARKQLLQFFEAWGLMDPVTLAARRKLSTLLFA